MTVWLGLAIGAVSVSAFSLLVGLLVARILDSIGRSVTEFLEAEAWASAPLTQSRKDAAVVAPEEVSRQRSNVARIR
jgi:hypothetical protein